MEHARKMVLIPHENIQEILGRQQAPMKTVQTPGTALTRLDSELSEILNSNVYANEREKWIAYNQVLQRHLRLVEHEKSLTARMSQNKTNGEEEGEKEEEGVSEEMQAQSAVLADGIKSRLNDTLIIDTVPKKFREKVKLLLRNMHRNASPGKIVWDKNGVVSTDGAKIPNSNIVDLVNDAMRARKHVRPVGRGHFAKFLQQIEMPREFIGNAELIEAAVTTSTPRKHGLLRGDNAGSRAITLERHADASGSRHGVSSSSSSSDSSLFLSGSPEDEDADKNREKKEDKIKSRRNKQQSDGGHSPTSIIKKKRNTERFLRGKMRKL